MSRLFRLLLLLCAFVTAASAATLVITSPATLPVATGGVAYSATLTATGGTPPYKWTVQSGGLPPGLTLSATGVISGVPSTSPWVYSYTFLSYFKVTDAKNATAFASLANNVQAPAAPPPPATFALTVTGGTGSGTYTAGTSVTINAAAAPTGKVFATWTGATVASATSAKTTLVMPAAATQVTATYQDAPTPTAFALTVNGGSGSGSYTAGTTVTIVAGAAPAGQVFAGWTGANVANAASTTTTLVMPNANVQVTATYQTPPPATYGLSVQGGSGSGSYAAGATVTITAGTPPAGQVFASWIGATVTSAGSATTTLVMPAATTQVTALFQAPAPPPPATPAAPANPILFVTQVPVGFDFSTVASAFSNHRPDVDSAGRGGDLYIRYPDGTLRNLTAEAGYGSPSGFQGANSISVREPSVSFDGTRALFSMVVGAPATRFGPSTAMWQLYEVTGLAQGQTAVITKVPNQPAYNNVSPCYGTDGRIIFVSDRPRSGQTHLYPQLDEYELAATTTGLWSLDPASGDLFNLNHTPSGAFAPSVDSFGRIVFIRWDHLQRDQEADIDMENIAAGQPLTYGTFNYTDESPASTALPGVRTEVFPEPRDPVGKSLGHTFNVFFPWMINQDGTTEETIDHIGRHELEGYIQAAIAAPGMVTFNYVEAGRFNISTYLNNFMQIKEDPTTPGRYFGVDGPEFSTHASGQIVAITAPAGADADTIPLTYITSPLSKDSNTSPGHPGHFRDPLPLSNGTLVAVHTPVTADETSRGVGSDYDFRIKTLQLVNGLYQPYQNLTPGFSKTVSYYNSGGGLVSYNGPLWELYPVEVRARPMPAASATPLAGPESSVFAEEGVNPATFQAWMKTNNLALIVGRNVTTRDAADRQQPYNLRIAGTTTQTVANASGTYDVSFLQLFQGDQIRGFGLRDATSTANPGRRVLAQPLHDPAAVAANPAPVATGAPAGSVQLGTDGSMAAFLPARRATTWQLADPAGAPVVRERYWLTFQPGEIRSCTSCHGINTHDQAGNLTPVNEPEALRALLKYWKTNLSSN